MDNSRSAFESEHRSDSGQLADPLKIFDMFYFWGKDVLALWDSMALSDLWPVAALMCLASTLRSDKTVTAVALTHQLPYSSFSTYWRVLILQLVNFNTRCFLCQGLILLTVPLVVGTGNPVWD